MTKKSKKVEKKRVVRKPIPKIVAKKRPPPEPEPPKSKKPKTEDKYVRLATDASQEEFRAIGERVQAGEVKWAYYAGDGNKGHHYYLVLPINKMTLKEKINTDFMEAYKAKDMKKKDFLGVLKGAIQTQEGNQIPSTDENVLKVIKSVKKGIVDSLENMKKIGADTSEQEMELTYLAPYEPKLMSEDEIRAIVKEMIPRIEPKYKNQGYLMGTFNKENHGKAFDNKVVSNIIKEELAC